jgi:hypothetical protein
MEKIIVAGVLAIFACGAFWAFVTKVFDNRNAPQLNFETAYNAMLDSLKIKPPDYDRDRRDVGTAYDLAIQPPWKCRVVHVVVNSTAMTIRITPIAVYDDFKRNALPNECADELKALALALTKTPAFAPYLGATSPSEDQRNTQLHELADGLNAKRTAAGTQGWAYLGRSDSTGHLTAARLVAQTLPRGQLTATHDISLTKAPPPRADADPGKPVGRALVGSTFRVLSVRQLAEASSGKSTGSYTWALVTLQTKGSSTAVSFLQHGRRVPTRERAHSRVVALFAGCQAFAETNSLHSPTQRWIYVGQKIDSNSFVASSSKLDTPCVPRDGAVARVTQSTKVYVGSDPHWPGVRPNGQALLAGTNVQVVGDVSGYPFDATSDPGFCERDPQPQRKYSSIPAGHQKRYCVYIPFATI